MPERLAKLTMKDGSTVEMFREDLGGLLIKKQDGEIRIPQATGAQTIALFALLEDYSENVEFFSDDSSQDPG